MDSDLFEQLSKSIKEAGEIARGVKEPSEEYNFSTPHVKSIRDKFGLTQANFATLLGISLSTLRNWEQGRRIPEGPAKVLLAVAERHPEAVLDTVSNL